MKYIIFFILFLAMAGGYGFLKLQRKDASVEIKSAPVLNSNESQSQPRQSSELKKNDGLTASASPFPIDRADERVNKKPFGLLVNPKNSPVQPENFSGYHTGADFEIFTDEADKEVPVFAICNGKIQVKKNTTGYGGVLVTSCRLDSQDVTVIYGHLKLSSINKNVEDKVLAGEKLGILGKGYSTETYGERKHLHLGIHKGEKINLLGYVKNQSGLEDWIDPCIYFCK